MFTPFLASISSAPKKIHYRDARAQRLRRSLLFSTRALVTTRGLLTALSLLSVCLFASGVICQSLREDGPILAGTMLANSIYLNIE